MLHMTTSRRAGVVRRAGDPLSSGSIPAWATCRSRPRSWSCSSGSVRTRSRIRPLRTVQPARLIGPPRRLSHASVKTRVGVGVGPVTQLAAHLGVGYEERLVSASRLEQQEQRTRRPEHRSRHIVTRPARGCPREQPEHLHPEENPTRYRAITAGHDTQQTLIPASADPPRRAEPLATTSNNCRKASRASTAEDPNPACPGRYAAINPTTESRSDSPSRPATNHDGNRLTRSPRTTTSVALTVPPTHVPHAVPGGQPRHQTHAQRLLNWPRHRSHRPSGSALPRPAAHCTSASRYSAANPTT